ncbi:MAG: aminopeptidase P N-terminal domain-containing protein [Bacteroidetes bacterium]|nr:aminopeptidase P N-terminal domain-containing protein [Fibrella sp.]
MKRLFIHTALLLITGSALAQVKPDLYDTDRLSPAFHAGRRAALREKMPPTSVAVFFANPERNRNNDTDYQYAQNPNLYYLTGYMEPNALLVITKEGVDVNGRQGTEFFFAQERNPAREAWTGRRLGKEGVETTLGLKNVYLGKDFKNSPLDFTKFSRVLSLLPEGVVDAPRDSTDLYSLMEQFAAKTAGQTPDARSLYAIMGQLRQVKLPEEMALLQKAIDISCQGHNEVMKFMEPGLTEYHAQSVMEYVFKSNGSEYVGYGSIAGGGENACVLHYVTNRRTLQDGDIFLADCGAEYHGYTADVTRTIPVNGKFSPEQKAIYEIVLAAQEAGFNACQPNAPFRGIHQAAFAVVAAGLFKLGIAKDSAGVRRYFNHGTSHSLGLDVHDPMVPVGPAPAPGLLTASAGAAPARAAGPSALNLMPGFVLTVEPGIYIPANSPCDPKWWNIGVRIEDDVLITETGHRILSASAPRTVADIEKMMTEQTTFKRPAKR